MTTMTVEQMQEIVGRCQFPEYTFAVTADSRGSIYLQGSYPEADVDTKLPAVQQTRRWLLSPFMTASELVQTVFKCVITSYEHRAREHFLYRGKAIFGPHYDVNSLWEVCNERGSREPS